MKTLTVILGICLLATTCFGMHVTGHKVRLKDNTVYADHDNGQYVITLQADYFKDEDITFKEASVQFFSQTESIVLKVRLKGKDYQWILQVSKIEDSRQIGGANENIPSSQ